jgi:hypothetical protein
MFNAQSMLNVQCSMLNQCSMPNEKSQMPNDEPACRQAPGVKDLPAGRLRIED